MKSLSFPSIHEIKITTGERSWTFSRSKFALISQRLYTLQDTSFFGGNLINDNNVVLELSKTAITESHYSKSHNSQNPKDLSPTDQNQKKGIPLCVNSSSSTSSALFIENPNSNSNTFTIFIPDNFSSSAVDSIIKYIYFQVADITEDTAIDLYCLSYSLGLTEVVSKTSSYIIFKFTPKRIVDAIRVCWQRQVDSGPFDRAIEAKFADFISELHNLPAPKIFNMLKQNHLKVSPDGLANLISAIALRHCKKKKINPKDDVKKDVKEEEDEEEEDDKNSEASSDSEKSDTDNSEEDVKEDDKSNETEDKNETNSGELNNENYDQFDCANFDSVFDIFALTEFLNFSECNPNVLANMLTSLGLISMSNDGGKSGDNPDESASAYGALKICGFAAQILKKQVEIKNDCKQLLTSLEKTASGVEGAAEYQLSIENERGLYTRRNLQLADHFEQVAIDKGDPDIVLKIADKYYDKRKDRETAFALYSRLLRPTESKDAKKHLSQEEIRVARSKCGEHIAARMREFLGPANSPDAVALLRLAISQGEENCSVFGYEFSLECPTIISEGYAIGSLIKVFGDFVVKIGAETIESEKFAYDKKLKSACIPPSVKRINDHAFSDCSSLEKVFIPPNVELIGTCAFSGCNSLLTVRLPRGLKEIGESAFNDCSSLRSIHVSIGCSFETIEYGCFNGCSNLNYLELPESLAEICDNAFCGCESLVSLRIPSTVRFIGEKAFMGCKSLEKILFDENSQLATIQNHAFSGCCSLLFLSLPPSLNTIGDAAFEGCELLQELHVPFGVETIGNSCFYRCESLKKIDLPPSVRYIRDYAFYQCHSLLELSLPLSLKEIGRYVFFQCVMLQRLTVASFDHLNIVFATGNRSSLRFLKLLSGPVSISEGQVVNFENLEEVEIPASVQSVMKGAFRGCRKIKNVVVESMHTVIDKAAFEGQPNIIYTN